MKKLENWTIKINDKDHYNEVIKVLNDFGYNTENCVYLESIVYGCFYRYEDIVCYIHRRFYNLKSYTLEEFVKAHNNFKNMKFRINSKEDYTKLLNHLFSLGYFKAFYDEMCNRNVKDGYLGYYIFTNDSGLVYGVLSNNEIMKKEYFEKHENPEYILEELITYELKEVEKVHCKNCGKEINTNMKNHFKFNNGSYLCWDCCKEVEHACFPF